MNPLSIFRHHQKLLLAIFGVVIMFTFTVGGIVTRYQGQGRQLQDTVVVSWKHGKVTEDTLREMRSYHILAVRFLDGVVGRAMAAGGTPRAAGLRGDPNGQIRDPGIPRSAAEEDIVRTMVLARKAQDMGMVVSDEAVLEFIDGLGGGKVQRDDLPRILHDATSGQFAEQQLLEQLRMELMAQQMGMMAASGLLAIPPDSAWDYFNRMNRRIKVELYPVKAGDLKDQVTEEPTEDEIKQLYNEAKNRYADPASPEAGFKRRRKIAFQYVKADYNKFLEKDMAAVTDQQIAEYYEQHKADFKEPDLPAKEEPKTSPAPQLTPPAKPDSQPKEQPQAKAATTPTKPAAAPDKPAAAPDKPAAATEKPAAASDKTANVKPDAPKTEPKPAGTPEKAKPASARPATKEAPQPTPKEQPKPAAKAPPKPAAPPAADAKKPNPADAKTTPKTSAWVPAPTTTFVSFRTLDGSSPDEESPAAKAEAKPVAKSAADAKSAAPADAKSAPAKPAEKPAAPKLEAPKTGDQPKAGAAKPVPPPAKEQPKATEPSKPQEKPQTSAAAKTPDDGKAKPVKYQPLEKVRDEIRRSLAREPAQKRMNEALKKAREAVDEYYRAWTRFESLTKANRPVEKPEPLDPEKLAEKLGLVAGDTPKVDELGIADFELGQAYRFSFTQRQVHPISFAQIAYADNIPLYRPDQIRSFVDVEYLFWKIEQDEPFVPALEDIRAEVVDTWKRRRAFQRAKAEAEKLAKTLKGDVPLETALGADRAQQVLKPSEFSWMSRGSLPMGSGMPMPSRVDGVDVPGMNFMQTVFGLKPNTIGTVHNQPETVAYVVRVVSESPSEDKRREQFLQSGMTGETQAQAALARQDLTQKWFRALETEMKVKWEREPHEYRDTE